MKVSLLTDQLLDVPLLARDSRLAVPVLTVKAWQLAGDCRECGTRTWPMGRDAHGHRREQCLHCGQRYCVIGAERAA